MPSSSEVSMIFGFLFFTPAATALAPAATRECQSPLIRSSILHGSAASSSRASSGACNSDTRSANSIAHSGSRH
eukprot:2480212-Pyramimonas_sp.AAC.1